MGDQRVQGRRESKNRQERREEEMCFRTKQNQKNKFQAHEGVDKMVHLFGRDVTASSRAPSGSNLQVLQHIYVEHSSSCA
jgi:hypothetical protein